MATIRMGIMMFLNLALVPYRPLSGRFSAGGRMSVYPKKESKLFAPFIAAVAGPGWLAATVIVSTAGWEAGLIATAAARNCCRVQSFGVWLRPTIRPGGLSQAVSFFIFLRSRASALHL